MDILTGVKGYLVEVLMNAFLMISDVERFSMYLSDIFGGSFGGKCLSPLSIFKIGFICFVFFKI